MCLSGRLTNPGIVPAQRAVTHYWEWTTSACARPLNWFTLQGRYCMQSNKGFGRLSAEECTTGARPQRYEVGNE
jgi:hypothetical protein